MWSFFFFWFPTVISDADTRVCNISTTVSLSFTESGFIFYKHLDAVKKKVSDNLLYVLMIVWRLCNYDFDRKLLQISADFKGLKKSS